MTLKLTAVAALLLALHAWTAALCVVVVLAFVLGRKSAIRQNGAQMIATGSRRLTRGAW